MGFEFGNAIAAVKDIPTQVCLKRLARSHGTDNSTLSTLVRNNVSTSTITAGAGLTGGGPLNASTGVTLDVGAGTGITVNADSISISSSYLGANPTGTVGLAAVNGTATTYLRSDGAPVLSQAIVPTWTGIHTFSAQDVHNAGVSLGTSGRLDSAVADAASAVSFLYQPTVALTSGVDRSIHRFRDSTGSYGLDMTADSTFQFFGSPGSNSANTGYIKINAAIANASGIIFAPTINASSGATIAGKLNAICGGQFRGTGTDNSNPSGYVIGGLFAASPSPVTSGNIPTGFIGGLFQGGNIVGANIGKTFAELGGWRTVKSAVAKNAGTFTSVYGGYIENQAAPSSGMAYTDLSGLIIEEQNQGGTTNNGIRLLSATAGRKLITFGSQSNWVAWETATTWSLNATTVLCKADFDVSAKNIQTDGTTGTKIALNATDKLGFFGIGPVVQPGAFTQTYSTASHTHANPTAAAVATTASTNVAPFGYTTAAQADDIIAQLNKLVTDMANVKNTLNAVIDDGQSLGLLA